MIFSNFFRGIFPDKSKKREPLDDVSIFMPDNPIIIEAGAHVGTDSIRMTHFFRKCRIYAFEPVNSLFKVLKQNTKNFKNIKCFNLALADKNGKSYINLSEGRSDGSSSLLRPKEHLKIHPYVLFNKRQRIECVTLKTWCMKKNINRIDFLWFDLQGFELAVLKHTGKALNTVKAIYAEVSLVENYQGGHLYSELKKWLSDKGFVIKKEYIYWADGGNVLFVRKDLLEE